MNGTSTSTAFETAHARVCELIRRFQRYARDNYLQPGYQEAEARKDFIDPLLKALGWDVDHEQEHNPYEQEVKVERGVSVARAQKRADYAFYLKPNYRDVRFFVEAKKPSVDLERSSDAHFQTLRYGYSANTPLSVLTDFEQIRVLDCRLRPHPDTALDQVYKSWNYTDFLDPARFAEFYWLFSREAHADGSYQRRIDELPKPKGGAKQRGLFKGGYQPVDASFLAELEEYRVALARAFKKADQALGSEALTEMVQRALDRLVFLRFLEDKQIETEIRISDFGKGRGAWADFQSASRRLDGIYNGIVFKRASPLDDPGFAVDDAVFADICERLSAENSPYNFDAIPIHILGSIYERFLGSIIRATDKHATVEEKPEVRKAGGVYYTPEYIVRYIVQQTVGKLIAGKSPAEVARLRFADIACGSGSFLLGIFDELLRHHADWYNKPEQEKQAKKDGCVKNEDGLWQLSLAQRRQILLNNIYGVDIDRQAVEVAQLSLFLKLLEDERATSARQYQLEYARDARLKKLLPDLSSNIVCGNSLIGWDIAGLAALDPEDERKLNPLDFEQAFPTVMRAGGFNAVLGNPPYGAEFDAISKKYLGRKFKAQSYQAESYLMFLELSLDRVISDGGYVGMIIPNPWLTNVKQGSTRLNVVSRAKVIEIVHFQFPVFHKQTVDTEIIILKAGTPDRWVAKSIIVESIADGDGIDSFKKRVIEHQQDDWRLSAFNPINIFLDPTSKRLASKISASHPRLDQYFDINVGVKPYQVGKGDPKQTKEIVASRPFDSDTKLDATYRQCLRGADISRYVVSPVASRFLKYGPWLAEPRPAAKFDSPEKLLIRQTGDSLVCALDSQGRICMNNMHVLVPKTGIPIRYFLGLVNSRLMNWYYQTLNPEQGEALAEVKRTNVARLPVLIAEASHHRNLTNRLVDLVDRMMEARQELLRAQSEGTRQLYERKAAAIDRQIDMLVYEMYGLTEAEIALVEGAA